MLEKPEGATKNRQSIETGIIEHARNKTKTNQAKNNTIHVGHHNTQTNANNVNKT
jgi:hypothetical protein